MTLDKIIVLDEWALIPGPISNPPDNSLGLDQIEEYSAASIADAILSYPRMRLTHDETPDWWAWTAEWVTDDCTFEIGFTLLEDETLFWGGSSLSGTCRLVDFLSFWAHLQKALPGCWMHNTLCEIHTPDSFTRFHCGRG